MRQQHPPVPAEPLDQAAPVHPLAVGENDVGHVGPVEALPLHDVGLGPEALLRGRHLHLDPHHLSLGGVLEPLVVHHGDAVPGAEDDVNEPGGGPDLGQPVGMDQVGLVAGGGAGVEQPVHIARPHEDVEVLGGSVDTRLMDERERSTDEERDPRAGEHLHGLSVEGPGRGFDHRVGGRQPHPALRAREGHHTTAEPGRVCGGSPLAGPAG
jgi:hypothetical protein